MALITSISPPIAGIPLICEIGTSTADIWTDCTPDTECVPSTTTSAKIFEEVSGNFDRVTVRDFELTFALETDITPYINGTTNGMVMMRKGETPKTINFGSHEYMQMELRRYFKLRSGLES